MALIRVTANEIKAKASGLRDLNNQFKTQVTNLENYEQSLASMWEGQAKDAFHNAFNNDKAQMDNFHFRRKRSVLHRGSLVLWFPKVRGST